MSSQKAFASTGDMMEKKISFTEVGPDLFAFTAEGDPNTGVIVGDDCCAVFDAQATPAMARQAGCGANRWIETPALLIVTKLDGGIACHSLPSRSSGSETRQRPRPSRTADV